MENEPIRETVATKLARMETKLDTIMSQHKELCEHVNHENQKMDARITTLENCRIENRGEKKGEKRVWKYISTGLGTFGVIVTILYYLTFIGVHL